MALTGDVDFDVSLVDVNTLELRRCDGVGGFAIPSDGPPGPKTVIVDVNHPNLDDVGCGAGQEPCACNDDQSSDGIDDLWMKFRTDEMVAALELDTVPIGGVISLVLTGESTDGTGFEAVDCIRIVPPGSPPGALMIGSNVQGVWVNVTPVDDQVDGGGFTSFNRAYPQGAVVTITAPEAPLSNPSLQLKSWFIDGVEYSDLGQTIEVEINGNTMTVAVFYERAIGIFGANPGFGGLDTR
jgi:hypothetical protein